MLETTLVSFDSFDPHLSVTYVLKGAAYLYKRDATTNSWNLIRKMMRSTPKGYDRCGMNVATSQGKALLGCDGADMGTVADAGAALFFVN
jgi:hypothetical protein